MKPILYDVNETDFSHNGLGILSQCPECLVTEEANSIYILEMEYPLDGLHFEDIQCDRIIKAKPNYYSDPQLFRISEIDKDGMGGIAKITAKHISYDLSGIPVQPFSAESAANAIAGIKANSVIANPFDFWTDKTGGSKLEIKTPMSARHVLGGVEGSILDTYGGEYEFDNFTVKLHSQRGMNRGVTIRYGKNLTDVSQEENFANLYTGVYPFWSNTESGEMVTLPETIVNVEGEFNRPNILVVDFSIDFMEKPTEEQLRSKTNSYIKQNNIGKPDVSLTLEYAQFANSPEYKMFAGNEQVQLFDEVSVEFERFKVSTTAKVVKIVYNVLAERVEEATIGSVRASVADILANQQQAIDSKPGKSDLVRSREAATAWLTNGKGYKVERRDANGNTIDTLYLDTPDINTAVNVLRIGQSGIGFSKNGVNGPYYSAWTLDGTFDASVINVINLIAEKVFAKGVTSTLEVNSARLFLDYDYDDQTRLRVFELGDNYGGDPTIEMNLYDHYELKDKMIVSPDSIMFGGVDGNGLKLLATDGEAALAINGEPAKYLSWVYSSTYGGYILVGK